MRRAEGARELLDGPLPPEALAASLGDLDRLNAWFGGYALTLAHIRRVAAAIPRARPMVVVDLGGGRGDLAVRVVRWARRAGQPLRYIVIDRDAASLAFVPRAEYPEILIVAGDATALPLRESGADVVTSSLTLHHLEPDDAVASLGQMRTAARHAIVVNDLERGYLPLLLVWVATRLLPMHPVSRHDGPLSVRRAYTATEVRALAEKAGLHDITIARHPCLGRLVAVGS